MIKADSRLTPQLNGRWLRISCLDLARLRGEMDSRGYSCVTSNRVYFSVHQQHIWLSPHAMLSLRDLEWFINQQERTSPTTHSQADDEASASAVVQFLALS